MIRWTGLAWAIALFTFTGCAVSTERDEARIGEAGEAAIFHNGLSPAALLPGTLDPGALAASPLDPGALDPGVLAALQDPGANGDLVRKHLAYTVSCAFDATQSFSFSWTDAVGASHDETYPGYFGLATSWADEALSPEGQQWISACMAARTNYYGVYVLISARAAHGPLSQLDPSEAASYTVEEGSFWGNLYDGAPALYACHVAADDDNSRSYLRDCAVGHLDPTTGAVTPCGMIQLLGTCDELCVPLDGAPGSPGCWSDPANPRQTGTLQPITVVLP
jgi:hypothetical protein